jgi:tyrosine-specific transport protein
MVVPVVCAQLGGDIDRIRKSIILGSLVPLAMFLSWDAVALCLAPLSGAQDPIDYLMRSVILTPFLVLCISGSYCKRETRKFKGYI